MTETRKDVGQRAQKEYVEYDSAGYPHKVRETSEPLPQPGGTMKKRAEEWWVGSPHGWPQNCHEMGRLLADFARLIEQETAQKWISVKERLPEHKQSVLVFREQIAPQMQQAKYFQQHSKGAGFYCGSLVDHVTHWMPLPSGPSSD